MNDPLIYTGKPKAGFVSALLKAIDNYLPRLNVISLPLLVIHGTDDTLVPIAASAVVFDNVSSRDKAFEVSWRHVVNMHIVHCFELSLMTLLYINCLFINIILFCSKAI